MASSKVNYWRLVNFMACFFQNSRNSENTLLPKATLNILVLKEIKLFSDAELN